MRHAPSCGMLARFEPKDRNGLLWQGHTKAIGGGEFGAANRDRVRRSEGIEGGGRISGKKEQFAVGIKLLTNELEVDIEGARRMDIDGLEEEPGAIRIHAGDDIEVRDVVAFARGVESRALHRDREAFGLVLAVKLVDEINR